MGDYNSAREQTVTSVWTNSTSPVTVSANNTADTEAVIDILQKMMDRISRIEDMALILNRNIDLEKRYPELKEAYDRYNEHKDHLQLIEILKSAEK